MFKFIIFHTIFLYPLTHCFVFFIAPMTQSTNQCYPNGGRMCTGTITNPYDSVSVAVGFGLIRVANFNDTSMTFNLIINTNGVFPLVPVVHSPFDTFPGPIIFQSVMTFNNAVVAYGVPAAQVVLTSEYFNIKILSSLTLAGIAIIGIDMHMDAVLCAQRPNPTLCTCLSETNLYNPASVCSINKPYVPNFNSVEPGFIQLIGPNAILNMTNSGFTYFNSFQRQVSIIYTASGISATVIINNFVVSQAYLAQSFFHSDSKTLSLTVTNLQLLRINEFYNHDLRATPRIFYIKKSQGTVSINNFDFQTSMTTSNCNSLQFFSLEDSNITLSVTAFRIVNTNTKTSSLSPITIFSVTNSLNQYNTLILNQLLIGNNNILFLCASPVRITVSNSNFNYSSVQLSGAWSNLSYSNVVLVGVCVICPSLGFTHMKGTGSNQSFSLTDCAGFYVGGGLINVFDGSRVSTLRVVINVIYGPTFAFGSDVQKTVTPISINATQLTVFDASSPVSSLLYIVTNGNFFLQDCVFANLYSYQGEGGAFLVYGNGAIFTLHNVTIRNSYSSGVGALISTFGANHGNDPILITMIGCLFDQLTSEIMGSIFLTNSILTIENCTFINNTAKIGSFLLILTSLVSIRNLNMTLAASDLESLIYVMSSEMQVFDSTFTELSGASACFMNSVYSQVNISNISISNSKCDDSLLLTISSQLSINNSNVLNFNGGRILFFRNANAALLNLILIQDCQIAKYSVIYAGVDNVLNFTSMQVIRVNGTSSGTALYANYNNTMTFDNFTLQTVVSQDVGTFFILGNNSLSISNSVFNDSRTAVSSGIFDMTLSVLRLKNCNFTNCNSEISGFMALNSSLVTIESSQISEVFSNKEASAILGVNSNVSLSFVKFSNIHHKSESLIEQNNIMILINNDLSENNEIIIENCEFLFDGNSSNILFSLSGVTNISFTTNSVANNHVSTIFYLVDSNFFGKDFKFHDNEATTFVNFGNSNNSIGLLFDLHNFEFNNNLIDTVFSFLGNVTVDSKNFNFIANKKKSDSYSDFDFFSFTSTNSINFENLICNDNEGFLDKYLFSVSKVPSLSLSAIAFSSNDFQFLKSVESSVFLSSMEIYSHLLKELIIAFNTTLLIEDSIFTKDSELDLSPCLTLGFCSLKTLSAANSSLDIKNTTFKDRQINNNVLKQYEIYIQGSDSIKISETNFTNDYSQSIYAQNVKSFSIEGCRFEILDTNNSLNGSLLFENTRDEVYNISIKDSSFINVKTQSNASALRYQNWLSQKNMANIEINNCTFSKNEASIGGAISFVGVTDLTIAKSSFDNNKANSLSNNFLTGFGGSVFSKCNVPNKCLIRLSESTFQNNFAELGGGIFLINYEITNSSMMTYQQNYAKVLDQNNNSNMSSPFFLNVSYFKQDNNEIFADVLEPLENISVNNFKPIEMKLRIYTLNNLPCRYINSSASASIFFINSTVDFNSSAVEVYSGTIDFPRILFNGKFENSYSVTVRLENSFPIEKTFTFYVRKCTIGEYVYNSLTCELCPLGRYSFVEPKPEDQRTICMPCPENSECAGKKIAPILNFWINSSEFTTEIIKCPIPGSCYYQNFDNFTKPMSCVEGYTGSLCVTCKKGFSKDGYQSKCKKCQWEAPEIIIFIVKLLFMLIFVSMQINSVLFSRFKKDAQFSGTSVKIVRDHFNQIFLIYSFCSIFQIDDSYFSVYQNVNDVVTGTTINFDCFYEEHYTFDIFFFKILSFMISPFVLHFLISFIFLAFFFLKKFILRKNVFIKCYFKLILVAFIVICDTQYTQILVSFLKLFECTRLDSNNPNTYLVYAPHIQCYSDEHYTQILFLGLPCLIIWIFGLPLIFFLPLYLLKVRNKHSGNLLALVRESRKTWVEKSKTMIVKQKDADSPKIHQVVVLGAFELDLDTTLMLSFLFSDYSEKRYYWTSVIMIWKAVISIIVTFITGDAIYYVLFGFYLCLNWLYCRGVPYQNDSIMHLIKGSLICNGISIVLGQYINSEAIYKNEIVIINLLLHLLFFAFAVFLNFKELDYEGILKSLIDILQKHQDNKISNALLYRLKRTTFYTNIEAKATTQIVLNEIEASPMSPPTSTSRKFNLTEKDVKDSARCINLQEVFTEKDVKDSAKCINLQEVVETENIEYQKNIDMRSSANEVMVPDSIMEIPDEMDHNTQKEQK